MSDKRTLAAFADQVAIAVHNMLLLRRTDEALDAQDGGARGGPGDPAQPAAEGVPDGSRLGVRRLYEAARIVGGDFYDFCDLPAARRGSAW